MISKKWIIQNQLSSEGTPNVSDFVIVEETISTGLQDGEILCKAEYLSVEPYVRAGGLEGKPLEVHSIDGLIPGSQIAKVIKSRHREFPEGSLVYGFFGWRDLTLYKPGKERNWKTIYRLPDMRGLPVSYALGACGVPGMTAYFGVEKILEIKNGGTLVVSTATGAVGNMVLQIGKMKGCKTLVFTSTDQKVIWLKTLGAGFIFNYNKVDYQQVFQEFAPEGIDFYFDNVGGDFTYHVMKNMKNHGRIAVCDAISCYTEDKDEIQTVPFDYLAVVDKKIRLEGFSVYDYENEWKDALDQVVNWILEGKITVEESILNGFESMPQAFIDRYEGKVVGMQVIKT